MFGVFKSHGPVCKHLHLNLMKMHQFFFTKNIDFYIFEPQKCKMNENYPQNTSKLWSIEMLMNKLKIIRYYCDLVRKYEFEKCPSISLHKCI